jgi:cytochrome b561
MSVHWWMAAIFLGLLISGKFMAGIEGRDSLRKLLFDLHKSFGVLVLLLLGWRIYLLVKVWSRKYRQQLPKLTVKWYTQTTLHGLLYLLMLAVPLSGYWLSNSHSSNNISLFWLPMPDIFPVTSDGVDLASAAHSRTSKAFAILLYIHAIGQYKVVKANWRRFASWIQQRKLSS